MNSLTNKVVLKLQNFIRKEIKKFKKIVKSRRLKFCYNYKFEHK